MQEVWRAALGSDFMIEAQILENKIFFRKGMRLAGPLDYEEFYQSLVRIADELLVSSVEVFLVYLEHRKCEAVKTGSQDIDVQKSSESLILQSI